MEIRLAKCFATVAAPTYFQDDCTCRAVFSIISSSRSMVVVAAHSEPVCRQSIYDDLWAGQNQRMKLVSDWSLHRFSLLHPFESIFTHKTTTTNVCVWLDWSNSPPNTFINSTRFLAIFETELLNGMATPAPCLLIQFSVCVCVMELSRLTGYTRSGFSLLLLFKINKPSTENVSLWFIKRQQIRLGTLPDQFYSDDIHTHARASSSSFFWVFHIDWFLICWSDGHSCPWAPNTNDPKKGPLGPFACRTIKYKHMLTQL